MNVLIAGANGRTGRRLIPLLKQRGHQPVALIRNESQEADLEALGAHTRVGDLERPLDDCLYGIDAIIFAAGSGSKTGKDKTILVDHLGAIRLAATAEFAGIRRFLMVSSIGADPDYDGDSIPHYRQAKGWADAWLRSRDTDWTIIKPGRLTEEAGQATVSLSTSFGRSGEISLDDVALAIAIALDTPNTIRKEFEILDGDTPVEDAIKAV